MRILIETSEGRHIRLHLPTSLLCNALTAGLFCKKSKSDNPKDEEEIDISRKMTYPQARKLMRCLRKCRHSMNGAPLAQIENHEGSKVDIYP